MIVWVCLLAGPPDPPAGRPSVTSCGQGSAVVTWSSPPYDGGCMLTGYSVEMSKASADPQWTVVADKCNSLSHTVVGLQADEKNLFRIRAHNVHGCSDASTESEPFVLGEVGTCTHSPAARPRSLATFPKPWSKLHLQDITPPYSSSAAVRRICRDVKWSTNANITSKCSFNTLCIRGPRWLSGWPARLPPRSSGFNPRPGHSGPSHVGIVPDDAVCRRVFPGISRFSRPSSPVLLPAHLNHPHRLSRPRYIQRVSPAITCNVLADVVPYAFVIASKAALWDSKPIRLPSLRLSPHPDVTLCRALEIHIWEVFQSRQRRGCGGVVVTLLASHTAKLGSLPRRVAPGFSQVRIMPDDAASRRGFSGISRLPHPCILVLLHTHLVSPSSALRTSMLRAVKIFPLTSDMEVWLVCCAAEESYGPSFEAREVLLEAGEKFRRLYEVLEELGKGRYGVVHKVCELASGRKFAAKFVRCVKVADRGKVHEEIGIMNMLRHPKLLQLRAAFDTPRDIVMVTDISGGELFERVVADDFTLTEKDCILFMRQICEGVDYMHQNYVVHLDLKVLPSSYCGLLSLTVCPISVPQPENIMCHTRTSHQIKLIDFGLAKKLDPDIPVRVMFGTPEFIPPEIINYEPIGLESDMWSVGVICYVLSPGTGQCYKLSTNNMIRYACAARREHCTPVQTLEFRGDVAFDARSPCHFRTLPPRGRGGVVVRPLASPSRRSTSDSRRDRSGIFASENHAGRCRWSAGFLEDLPFPPAFAFWCCSVPRSTLIDSQDPDIKSRRNFFTRSLFCLKRGKLLQVGGLSGLSPFMGDNDAQTFNNITKADYDFEDEAFDAISQDSKDFISSLLVKRKDIVR
ncbi:hypothetical protein PR048_003470 [Dryococelus australis]|uniref:Myosin light chain kinase, smooth muscle n=1 Tax=Dryococelus australis TaxID=614101 RepID=A0ABQ9IN55_9NEOP|nr:hypothetical protein PR048_003470 [Dryococelus australis]